MKNVILKRWWLHFVVGIFLNYIIGHNQKFVEYLKYTDNGNTYFEQCIAVVLGVLASAFAVWCIAGLFEVLQGLFVKLITKQNVNTFDWNDVHSSGYGAIVGGTVCIIFDNEILNTIAIIGIVTAFVYEIVRIIIALKK